MISKAAYSVNEVANILKGKLEGKPSDNMDLRFLLCDSRQLIAPEHTLFFALKTKTNDGHRYVTDLLEKGVRNFVVNHVKKEWLDQYPDAAFVVHKNPIHALQILAAHHRSVHNPEVLAITGSNGKTVVKEWLNQLLFNEKQIVRNPKSYNSQIGVPLSAWLIESHHELGIFEAGISLPGEMAKLERILKPDTGILTNIGSAHDEGFSSREHKLSEKLQLFDNCKTLIYCGDQQFVNDLVCEWQKTHPSVKLFSWGRKKGAQVRLIKLQKSDEGTLISVSCNDKGLMFSIPFRDDASIENAMHCLTYLLYAGYSHEFIIRNMYSLQAVAMRLEMKEGINDSTIINDTYNSDLQSLSIALDFLGHQTRHKKKTLVLSDILQSGISSAELYEKVASLVNERQIDRFIGIGPEISSQSKLFLSIPAQFYKNTESFIEGFDFSTFRQEAILLKGARPFGFERLSNLLQQKDHQTLLEIRLDSLIHNFNVFKALLETGTKTMCMVKAFSYGSGSVEVARMLQYHQADYLAVAYADEGKELRGGGVHIPIVVMNPEIRTFEVLFRYRLEPEVYGFPILEKLIRALHGIGLSDECKTFPVHIKLDTGMHRLGFLPVEIEKLGTLLSSESGIRVASVFSHFAASEDPVHDSFSYHQIDVFKALCSKLEQLLGYSFLRHMCNSAGISRFPEAHFEMVRPGIGLYGVCGDPKTQELLQHVSTFRSLVSQVKTILKGDTVGYGREGRANDDMKIAVVPVGYADGLNRRLGNGNGSLYVGGRKVPIVGNISMDMCTIDITGMDVKEGDEVIIFGKELPVQEMASALGTIPYEVFTSVSQRVKRVYYQE